MISESLTFGVITDLHYADREPDLEKGRWYRRSLSKLAEFVDAAREARAAFVLQLGDFKDQREPPDPVDTLRYLREIERVYRAFDGPRLHALGNHDMDSLTKAEVLREVGRDSAHGVYSRGGWTFLTLDPNFNDDGSEYAPDNLDWERARVPPAQLDWLRETLAAGEGPAIVFCHQKLDGEGRHTVVNAPEVRAILAESGRVRAVLQGHDHQGGHSRLDDIDYHTLRAAVDGPWPEWNAYYFVTLSPDGTVTLDDRSRGR